MTPSHLTLTDCERSNSRSLGLRSVISVKATALGHILLLSINTLLKIFKESDSQSHIHVFGNILGKILPDCSPV